ncbi:G2/M phase-specific E3 ubiquitin-protein ligase-like [Clytia hemisphaerica]|uniref:RING-type domain-containing protein n=1 Tax=Clytia hemisphaerica TaxID=252671 RepID=A0A7M5X009_9CNID
MKPAIKEWAVCSICTNEIEDSPAHLLSCKCRFHRICLEMWTEKSMNCPTCATKADTKYIDSELYDDIIEIWHYKFSDVVNIDLKDRSDLSIRRSNLYTDTLRKIPRIFKKGLVPLNVTFTDKPAADNGGPTREYFSEIFDLFIGKLVHGDTGNYSFVHDLVRLGKNEYMYFGYITALALVHGCPGPRYFCKSLMDFIFTGNAEPTIDEIPDAEVKQKLQAIEECLDEKSFQDLMKDFFERFDSGYVASHVAFQEKEELIKTMSYHYVISCAHQEISQFISGIETGYVLLTLKCHDEFKKEFVYDENLITADRVKRIFKRVEYSQDAYQHGLEKDVYFNFVTMFETLEDSPVEVDSQDLEDKITIKTITLSDVLKYLTGSRFLPLYSETKYSVKFCPSEPGRRSSANSCACVVYLPLNSRYVSEENFTHNFLEDMIENSNKFTIA